jgi:hypothetical protein
VCRVEDRLYGAQNLRQRFRVQLGRSTRAGRQTGQADLFANRIFFRHIFLANRDPKGFHTTGIFALIWRNFEPSWSLFWVQNYLPRQGVRV